MFYKIMFAIVLMMVYIDIILIAGLSSGLIVLVAANVFAFGLLKANAAYVFLIAWGKITADLYFWRVDQIKKRSYGYD